jgi:hypothetical protein
MRGARTGEPHWVIDVFLGADVARGDTVMSLASVTLISPAGEHINRLRERVAILRLTSTRNVADQSAIDSIDQQADRLADEIEALIVRN